MAAAEAIPSASLASLQSEINLRQFLILLWYIKSPFDCIYNFENRHVGICSFMASKLATLNSVCKKYTHIRMITMVICPRSLDFDVLQTD